MGDPRIRVIGSRVLGVAVVVVVVVGAVWALRSPATHVPERIAIEAAPDADWELVAGTDPGDRGGLAGLPLVGELVDPGRGEWVWQASGPRSDEVRDAVVSWVLGRPGPDPASDPTGIAEVAPSSGIEGRTWDGRVAATDTTSLTGVTSSALRSVTVSVVIQPVALLDDLTQVTVLVE